MRKLCTLWITLLVTGCGFYEYLPAFNALVNFHQSGLIAALDPVASGLNCWDFDQDASCDESDDWNGPEGVSDGFCDAWDCKGLTGPEGPQGLPGAPNTPAESLICHDGVTAFVNVAWLMFHLAHGDTTGPCPVSVDTTCEKIVICHKGESTKTVCSKAWPAHEGHGDEQGVCDD